MDVWGFYVQKLQDIKWGVQFIEIRPNRRIDSFGA